MQCGTKNDSSVSFFGKCGTKLPENSPNKSKAHLIIVLISGVVILIAALNVIMLTLSGGSSLLGPWHNEDLNQLLIKSSSLTADGFHSLSDGDSNIVGLLGIWMASRPKDESHPYGHSKFETLAGLAIAGMLVVLGD
jgi:hypothetical protein